MKKEIPYELKMLLDAIVKEDMLHTLGVLEVIETFYNEGLKAAADQVAEIRYSWAHVKITTQTPIWNAAWDAYQQAHC